MQYLFHQVACALFTRDLGAPLPKDESCRVDMMWVVGYECDNFVELDIRLSGLGSISI